MPATQAIELQSAPAGSTEPERSQELQSVAVTGQSSAADQKRSQEPLTADEISATAYGLYVAGGYQDGHDLEHWFEAERLLISQRQG